MQLQWRKTSFAMCIGPGRRPSVFRFGQRLFRSGQIPLLLFRLRLTEIHSLLAKPVENFDLICRQRAGNDYRRPV